MLIPWFRSLLVSTQTCWLPNIFLAICDLPLFFPRFHRQSMTLLATVTWVFAANVPCVESENSWGITPIAEASFLQRWLRERLLRYFSFKAIFEEKWGRESMASCCLGEVTFSSHDAHIQRIYRAQWACWQEPLQKDRRYMLAVMPHGVIPFASTLDRRCYEWL